MQPIAKLALAAAVVACIAAEEALAQKEIRWQPPVDIAAGGGNRGEWRQNESQWDYVDDPTVALQPDGAAAVAWVDQARKDVFFQVYGRDARPRLAQPVNVSSTPAVFSWLPRIALAPDRPNEIYILWQEIVFSGGSHGGDIFFARSHDGGATFAEPLNLSRSIGGDGKGRIDASHWDNGSLDVAVARDGAIVAAWTEYNGALWFSRSNDRGASFPKPLRVAGDDTRPARAPALAVGSGGEVYLAWTYGEDRRADIHVARSENGGRAFGEPVAVAKTGGYSDAPKLALEADGALHLVFHEAAGGPFSRSEVRYARSTDQGRTFSPPRSISTPVPRGNESAAFPSLVLGARGDLYAVWELFPGSRSGGRGLAIAMSRDGGQTFSAPALVPGSIDPGGGMNGSNQGKLMRKLAVNADGRVAIVNSSLKRGERSRVWLIRGD